MTTIATKTDGIIPFEAPSQSSRADDALIPNVLPDDLRGILASLGLEGIVTIERPAGVIVAHYKIVPYDGPTDPETGTIYVPVPIHDVNRVHAILRYLRRDETAVSEALPQLHARLTNGWQAPTSVSISFYDSCYWGHVASAIMDKDGNHYHPLVGKRTVEDFRAGRWTLDDIGYVPVPVNGDQLNAAIGSVHKGGAPSEGAIMLREEWHGHDCSIHLVKTR